jgi:hypothetical protein
MPWPGTSDADLMSIRDTLVSSPGMRGVVLQFEHKDGRRVRVHPAEQYRVAWAPQIEERLERWIVKEE